MPRHSGRLVSAGRRGVTPETWHYRSPALPRAAPTGRQPPPAPTPHAVKQIHTWQPFVNHFVAFMATAPPGCTAHD